MPKDWATSVDLHLDVDTAGGRRTGLERALRTAIADGRLAPGAALPSTRALSAELGFARGTVTAAYDQLIAEGCLVARPRLPHPRRAARLRSAGRDGGATGSLIVVSGRAARTRSRDGAALCGGVDGGSRRSRP